MVQQDSDENGIEARRETGRGRDSSREQPVEVKIQERRTGQSFQHVRRKKVFEMKRKVVAVRN